MKPEMYKYAEDGRYSTFELACLLPFSSTTPFSCPLRFLLLVPVFAVAVKLERPSRICARFCVGKYVGWNHILDTDIMIPLSFVAIVPLRIQGSIVAAYGGAAASVGP